MTSLIERRSLKVRKECRDQVLLAMKSRYENQTQLAIAVNSTQPVISQFINYKPVETGTFIAICDKLKLAWQEIADPEMLDENDAPLPNRGDHFSNIDLDEHPWGELPIGSRFYIQRPPIEQDCYEAIRRSAALIRIKAARQMGKSSLLSQIMHQAVQQGDRTIRISLESMDNRFLADYDTFLRWLCRMMTRKLDIPDPSAQYWETVEQDGSNECFKYFLEKYLLTQDDTPLTLGLDEVDRIFEYKSISHQFFPLLREIHETGKHNKIWKRFRLILVHSTEVYLPTIHQSPFNVGLPIELKGFTLAQTQELAQRYPLPLTEQELQPLMDMVGGHPFLVRQAMDRIHRHSQPLAEVLDPATMSGIYSSHLHHLELILTQYPPLLDTMQQIAKAKEPMPLRDRVVRDKLQAIGLIKPGGNGVLPSCELYRQYFQAL